MFTLLLHEFVRKDWKRTRDRNEDSELSKTAGVANGHVMMVTAPNFGNREWIFILFCFY